MTDLPDNLSMLKTLEELDISNNLIHRVDIFKIINLIILS